MTENLNRATVSEHPYISKAKGEPTYPPLPTSWDMFVPYMTGEAGESGTWYLAMIR